MVIYFNMKRYVLVAARTGRAIARVLAEELEEPGITYVRLDVLLLLRDGPLLQRDLSIAFCVCPSVMCRILGALEKLGYVKRTKLPGDRRQRIVEVTDAGLAVVARLDFEGDCEGASIQFDVEEDVRIEWHTLFKQHHVAAEPLTLQDSAELIFELIPTLRRTPPRRLLLGMFETRREPPMSPHAIERVLDHMRAHRAA